MFQEQTKEYISNLSDLELIEYIKEGIYEPEAIEFAKQEVAARNLDPQRLAELESSAQLKNETLRAQVAEAAERPLGKLGKVLAIIGGLNMLGIGGICLLIAWGQFRERGERLKIKEMWRRAMYGFVVMWLILILLFVIPWQWFAPNP